MKDMSQGFTHLDENCRSYLKCPLHFPLPNARKQVLDAFPFQNLTFAASGKEYVSLGARD